MSSEWTVGKVEPLPAEWQGRKVGLMDALLYARKRIMERRGLWSVTGGETIESLFHFTIGWASNTQFNGESDQEWCDFLDWLDEVEPAARYEGWHVTFLRECGGDHERAVLKFLDRAHEFVSLRRSSPKP
ncbi:hypothetical protein [Cystobacter ferrugineus]|uniref:Uncharacterized protein n=1 Tax=Cystobacter ferrugineus TaxID=83449 RepID=A0A1L9B3P3_9BACT|nr:hypothetical protein [Cystobacter ferrugineus]OJH36885.1 hypothetical protein BON30_30795 [Cystobacter ferrugineus]